MLGAVVILASAFSPVAYEGTLANTYPSWAVWQGRSSAAVVELVVEQDGQVRDCRVSEFVGSEKLANEDCTRLKRRRFEPARDHNGNPVLGLVSARIVRVVKIDSEEGEAVKAWTPTPDLTMYSAAIRDDEVGVTLGVALLIRSDGSIAECKDSGKNGAKSSESRIKIACAMASEKTWPQMTTASGEPTHYVRTAAIRFAASEGAGS